MRKLEFAVFPSKGFRFCSSLRESCSSAANVGAQTSSEIASHHPDSVRRAIAWGSLAKYMQTRSRWSGCAKIRLSFPVIVNSPPGLLCSQISTASREDFGGPESGELKLPNQGSGKSSVDSSELARFTRIADSWWDHDGPYKPLHVMNPTRIAFIRAALCRHFGKDPNTPKPLQGLTILDVGSGGGLACEPLARLGGQVTGIDAGEKNVVVASLHARRDPATSGIIYRCTTAEQLVQEKQQFDAVISLEVIEHVTDPRDFCKSLAALTKKDGFVIISTINRSLSSWGLAIVAAEYIFGWLPRGTHQWSKLITPEEIALLMDHAGLLVQEIAGMAYNPLTRSWSLSDDTSINYIASGIHQGT